ncbi:MAG: OmpH family outer membrane protein [bacterium]
MADDRKSRIWLDVALVGIPLLLVAAGAYLSFMRAPKSAVAVINMDRVLQETGVTERVRDAERRWMNTVSPRINEVAERTSTQALELEAQIAKAADSTARKALQGNLRRLQAEAQAAVDRSRQDFLLYREGLRREIRAKVDPAVRNIARARRCDVVIDSGDGRSVLYARAAVDITDEVIKDARSVLAKVDFGGALSVPANPSSPGEGSVGAPVPRQSAAE